MDIKQGIEIAKWIGKNGDVLEMERLQKLAKDGEHFITFWGHYSAGKSKLINNILSRDILPVQSRETTATLTYIRYGKFEECVVHFISGEKIDVELSKLKEIYQNTLENIEIEEIDYIEVFLEEEILEQGIILVDTPGVNTIIQRHQELAIDAISQSGMIVYVLGTSPTKVDRDFISQIDNCKIDILFVRTKCDCLNRDEEDENLSIEKDRESLSKMVTQQVRMIPVSNEKDSHWFLNIVSIQNELKEISVNLKERIQLAMQQRVNAYVQGYKEELKKQRKLIFDELEGKSSTFEDEIRKYDDQLEDLKEREEVAEKRIKSEVSRSKRKIEGDIDEFLERSTEKLKKKLNGLVWTPNLKDEAEQIYKKQVREAVQEIYLLMNRYFNEILEEENQDMDSLFSELSLELPKAEIAIVEHEGDRMLSLYRERYMQRKAQLEEIEKERGALEIQAREMKMSIEEVEYQGQEAIKKIEESLAEIPTEPALIYSEPQGIQPSEIFKRIGQAADLAFLVLPGDAILKGGATLFNQTSVGKKIITGLKSSSSVVKEGKILANLTDNVRDTGYVLGKLQGMFTSRKKQERLIDREKTMAVDAFVRDKAGKMKEKFEDLKEKAIEENPNLFDMMSIAYWTKKIGEKFDRPPKIEIDYSVEEERRRKKEALEHEKKRIIEEGIQKKKKFGRLLTKQEEFSEREKQQRIAYEQIGRDMEKFERELQQQANAREKQAIVEKYVEHYELTMEESSKKMLQERIGKVDGSINFYVARENAQIKRAIDEKKAKLEQLRERRNHGKEELERQLQKCDEYLEVLS